MTDGKFSTSVDSDGAEVEFNNSQSTLSGDTAKHYSEPNTRLTPLKKHLKRILIAFLTITLAIVIFVLSEVVGSGKSIITISPTAINPKNNDRLIYITGTPDQNDLKDPIFNVSTTGSALFRIVEMYQWAKENEQYTKKWSEELIQLSDEDSKNKGFVNPTELPFSSEKWMADKIKLGKFTISPELAKQIEILQPLALSEDDFKKLHPEGQLAFKLVNGGYFFGINPIKPNIGDLRINFKSSPLPPITIVGKQSGESLVPYVGKNGSVGIARTGTADFNIITQEINTGKSIIPTLIFRIMSIFLIIIGAFIAIGKNPFSLKNKRQKPNYEPKSRKKQKETDDILLDVLEEEDNVAVSKDFTENSKNHLPDISTDDFMTEGSVSPPGSDQYIHPIPASPNIIGGLENSNQANTETRTKEAPPSLEFYSENPSTGYASAPSPLNQFGITNEPSLPPSGYSSNNYTELSNPNYENNTYASSTTEEMPVEVEVLSDDTTGDLQEISSFSETHNNTFSESFAEAIPTEMTALDLPAEIPDGVDIIAETEDANSAQGYSYNSVPEKDHNTSTTIDFYPDSNEKDTFPIENSQQSSHQSVLLPPFPDFDSIFKREDVAPQPAAEVNNNITSEVAATTLQSTPDFESIFKQEDVASQTAAEENNNIAPEIAATTLPSTPDFDSLFSEVKANKVAAQPKPTELTFDLPPIDNNFDPTVEMPTPKDFSYPISTTVENGEDSTQDNSDIYSPFGNGIDDPFFTPEEDKK